VLAEIGAGETPAISPGTRSIGPRHAARIVTGARAPRRDLQISATTGRGLPDLLAGIERWIERERVQLEVAVPSARGDLVAWLHRDARVVAERYDNGRAEITAMATPKMAAQIRKRLRELECSTSPTS
jgi:50S ribosomal subunit-associated GTPase HflX